MPNNKNQHYVPQFLLKNFSSDKKSISMCLKESGRILDNVSIRNQCSKPYFYPDQDYEKTLGQFESDCHATIEKVLSDQFQFYRKVYNKLTASLPKPFALKNGIRIEDSPMHVALREAFVNCLIHCDYTVNSNIIVESYRNKYVFSNPGNLLISLSQYFTGGESKCRNTSLQQMFMQIGNAEKAGSGVDKIIKGWKSANYRYPAIEEKSNKVILTLPLESILSEEVQFTLKKLFGENIISIDHEELLVLAACATEGFTSNYRMQLVLEKHPSDITLLLKNLCQEGYLVSSGIGKGTTYYLNENYIQQSNIDRANNQSLIIPDSSQSQFSTSQTRLSKECNDASNVVSSSSNVVSSSSNVVSSDTLLKAKRGKLNLQELQKQILVFCKDDYKSIEEIAKGVGKTIKYLNNGIISKMVADGQLDRKYPKIPTHPDQQYKTHPIKNKDIEPRLF